MTLTDDQLKELGEHTPGPWKVDSGNDGDTIYLLDVGTIAHIPIDLIDHRFNAALFALAPEMRVALIEARAEVKRLRAENAKQLARIIRLSDGHRSRTKRGDDQ